VGGVLVEYVLLVYLSTDRWQTVRAHKLDLVLVLIPFLRPLRLVRLVRLAHAGTAIARTGAAVTQTGVSARVRRHAGHGRCSDRGGRDPGRHRRAPAALSPISAMGCGGRW
jgi:hypothetical protein